MLSWQSLRFGHAFLDGCLERRQPVLGFFQGPTSRSRNSLDHVDFLSHPVFGPETNVNSVCFFQQTAATGSSRDRRSRAAETAELLP